MTSLKKKALSGFLWTSVQQFSLQVINFIVQIILARILMPEDFGLIALLVVFISIGQLLMDGGMTSSLIRTVNPTQKDYSTVFITNMIVSLVVYVLVYFSAPLVGDFYEQKVLVDLLRVYASTFIIRAFIAVHLAKLTKEMDFKSQARLQIPSTLIGAFVGVSMAYNGYGVWSLVGLNLSQAIFHSLQVWIFVKWRPSFVFDWTCFKYHFNFGYKMTLSGLLNTVYLNIYTLVIGKFYSPLQTGYFNQAEKLRIFPPTQISSVIVKVTYPLLSNITNEDELRQTYIRFMKIVFSLIVPVMMFLIVSAEDIFLILLGEKWLPAVPYFQILSLGSIIYPIGDYNVNILKVKGKSDVFLKLEILKKAIGFLAILTALYFDMYLLIISYVVAYHIMVFLDAYYSGKYINYSVWQQVNDLYKIYIIGVFTAFLIYLLKAFLENFFLNYYIVLIISLMSYILLYLMLIQLFEKALVKYVKQSVASKLN